MLADERRRVRLPLMKTLTLELDETTYESLIAQAQRTGRTEADVVRAALESLPQRTPVLERGEGTHSLRDFKPLGLHLKPGALDFDDILGEMIDDSDRD